MADDGVDEDLVAFLRQSLGIGSKALSKPQLNVLKDARFICDNAIDVAIDPASTKHAAEVVWTQMQSKGFSKGTWSSHELHPKAKTVATLELIFTIDLLNFSFWPDQEDGPPFAVEYRGHTWTGYWSLVAALQRALDEGKVSRWIHGASDDIDMVRHTYHKS
ncbi:hypothetical protein MMC25_005596 [Agyrium rufum]|nr:hypothetical protein [Agyrium rufum]